MTILRTSKKLEETFEKKSGMIKKHWEKLRRNYVKNKIM